ncbi:hypothetical protein C8J57DRAFT_1524931 [Mycena rebaudengoi]|nr:hypothetical protein C8J57DRAFT_1524931 [Mycena rebaudengoi]
MQLPQRMRDAMEDAGAAASVTRTVLFLPTCEGWHQQHLPLPASSPRYLEIFGQLSNTLSPSYACPLHIMTSSRERKRGDAQLKERRQQHRTTHTSRHEDPAMMLWKGEKKEISGGCVARLVCGR